MKVVMRDNSTNKLYLDIQMANRQVELGFFMVDKLIKDSQIDILVDSSMLLSPSKSSIKSLFKDLEYFCKKIDRKNYEK